MDGEQVFEIKHTLDGRTQTFACLAVHLSPRLAIVRFDHTSARTAGGYYFPARSVTLGCFWPRRSYNCYRIAAPDGAVIAYRFDVVDRVRIRPGHISYRDLLLDAWLGPAGEFTVEDEEDVVAAASAGRLTPAMTRTIARTRSLLMRRAPHIAAEVEAVVERLAAETLTAR